MCFYWIPMVVPTLVLGHCVNVWWGSTLASKKMPAPLPPKKTNTRQITHQTLITEPLDKILIFRVKVLYTLYLCGFWGQKMKAVCLSSSFTLASRKYFSLQSWYRAQWIAVPTYKFRMLWVILLKYNRTDYVNKNTLKVYPSTVVPRVRIQCQGWLWDQWSTLAFRAALPALVS